MVKSSTTIGVFLLVLNSNCLCTGKLLENRFPRKLSEKFQDHTFKKLTTVTLTQKNYIQFLRYQLKIPRLDEFTFCIWMKSSNFSHPQPILSYSKNEETRLVRVWVAPGGREMNMAIWEIPVFKVSFSLLQNVWYHHCISWNSRDGRWIVILNGIIINDGVKDQLKNVLIPEGGDLVIGQEYTDMNKGLDDGIEGTIFGFNMVLSSIYEYIRSDIRSKSLKIHEDDAVLQRQRSGDKSTAIYRRLSGSETLIELPNEMDFQPKLIQVFPPYSPEAISFDGKYTTARVGKFLSEEINTDALAQVNKELEFRRPSVQSEIKKSLGYQLVELSFNHCTLGNGAPLVGNFDGRILISWMKTPVRIFGGAILIKVQPFC